MCRAERDMICLGMSISPRRKPIQLQEWQRRKPEPAPPPNPLDDPKTASVRNPVRKRCENCGKLVMIMRPYQRFCSAKCRREFHDAHNSAYGHVKHLFARELDKHLNECQKLTARVDELERRIEEQITRIADMEMLMQDLQNSAKD